MLKKINSHNYTNLWRFSNSSLNDEIKDEVKDEIKIEIGKNFLEVNENEIKQTLGTHCKTILQRKPRHMANHPSEESRALSTYTQKSERI